MADLIAQGNEPQQRWRRRLPEGRPVILGRTGTWAVGWDLHISRRHVRLLFEGGRLRVSRLPEARNPVYYIGQQRDNRHASTVSVRSISRACASAIPTAAWKCSAGCPK